MCATVIVEPIHGGCRWHVATKAWCVALSTWASLFTAVMSFGTMRCKRGVIKYTVFSMSGVQICLECTHFWISSRLLDHTYFSNNRLEWYHGGTNRWSLPGTCKVLGFLCRYVLTSTRDTSCMTQLQKRTRGKHISCAYKMYSKWECLQAPVVCGGQRCDCAAAARQGREPDGRQRRRRQAHGPRGSVLCTNICYDIDPIYSYFRVSCSTICEACQRCVTPVHAQPCIPKSTHYMDTLSACRDYVRAGLCSKDLLQSQSAPTKVL